MIKRRFFIETFGCQMNIYDSGVISEMLAGEGHEPVDCAAEADLILINTCSVRDRAERKVLTRLSELSASKKGRPDLLLGVVGCMAQRLGRKLTENRMGIDLVVGPDSYGKIGGIVAGLAEKRGPAVETTQDSGCMYAHRPRTFKSVSAFVTIMRGCDNFCSYCVVPYVRGRERSKPLGDIIMEIEHLVALGVKEVTLLGQNVNSYGDGKTDFAALLEAVDGVKDLRRIRFTTSHPKDLAQGVIERIRDLPRVCEHLHLPLQSGSDRILALMNRGYTYSDYTRIVELARSAIPSIVISTDIMVGFPGETRSDHEATLRAMEEIAFDSAFMFKYSLRAGTHAAGFTDDVKEDEKVERLRHVIELENSIVDTKKQALLGGDVEILVQGESRRETGFLVGRTRKNWLAKLPQKGVSKGEVVVAEVTGVTRWMISCDGSVRKAGA
ncbi:MAG: tRNA (N6-isopentenyl adenosine(37)-C2)-methylthiotransferase MiaB [Candidatus Eisenbacteria bacterium]